MLRPMSQSQVPGNRAPREPRRSPNRITLDSMVQFVGLLDADGTVLEINKVALDAVGIKLSDVEGKPFWTTFWWQVSRGDQPPSRDAIARAAQANSFAGTRRSTAAPAAPRRSSSTPRSCRSRTTTARSCSSAAEGRDITEKKAQEAGDRAEEHRAAGSARAHPRARRDQDAVLRQRQPRAAHAARADPRSGPAPADRRRAARCDSPSGARPAQVIARNARMLLKHVNDLLDMSKLEAGKLKIELQDDRRRRAGAFLASHFDVLAAERGVEPQRRYADVPASRPSMRTKLQRVVMNLLVQRVQVRAAGGRIAARCMLPSETTGWPCLSTTPVQA